MLGLDSVDSVAHVIQVALAPVFLLSGLVSLLAVLSTRLGRVADRVDSLAEQLETAELRIPTQSRHRFRFEAGYRHLLRLHHGGVSAGEIGRRLGVARSTVQDNLKRAAAAGLAWPLADDVTDDALELRLFGRAGNETGRRRRIKPDWAALARELKRPARR